MSSSQEYPPDQPRLRSFNFLTPSSHSLPRRPNDPAYLPPSLPGRRSSYDAIFRMGVFIVLPVVLAGAHHAIYASKNGKVPGDESFTLAGHEVDDQARFIFVGTLLVFVAKSCLILSILTAFDQILWRTVRRSRLRLQSLDALFSVPNDPFAFFTAELWTRAKLAIVVALIAWLLPISLLVVPGTLSVVSAPDTTNSTAVVPTVDVADQDLYLALATLNPLRAYVSPAPLSSTIAARTLTSGGISLPPSPCGADCSYSLNFTGPSFSCSAPSPSAEISNQSTLRYRGSQTIDELQDVFTVAWLDDLESRTGLSTNCTVWMSDYDVSLAWKNGSAFVTVDNVHKTLTFGTADPLTNWGASEVGGVGAGNPRGLAVMAALKDALTALLNGTIIYSSQTGITTVGQTLALFSTLPSLDPTSTTNGNGALLAFSDVPNKLESLLINTTLSIMAYPLYNASVPLSISNARSVYSYDAKALWAGYGAALGVTAVVALIGLRAVRENGGSGNRSFTILAATTRNAELDAVFQPKDEGEKHVSLSGTNEAATRLRYREVERVNRGFEEGELVKWAFGT
ncbi:hypothetical protein BT69DRAFT_1337394 [Atractiella rhizophila]|nr:hypothetical protein BT69DRAFT_1337394 [Atractiella rhizophila]